MIGNIFKTTLIEFMHWKFKIKFFLDLKFYNFRYEKNYKQFLLLRLKGFLDALFAILITLFILIIVLYYVICCLAIGFAISSLILLLGDIDKQLWTLIISIVTAIIGLVSTSMNLQSHDKKEYILKRKNTYIKIIVFFNEQMINLKTMKPMDDFNNFEELLIYSSNIVIGLLSQIKKDSEKLQTPKDIDFLLYKLTFLIDVMRVEISYNKYPELFIRRYWRSDYINLFNETVELSRDDDKIDITDISNEINNVQE